MFSSHQRASKRYAISASPRSSMKREWRQAQSSALRTGYDTKVNIWSISMTFLELINKRHATIQRSPWFTSTDLCSQRSRSHRDWSSARRSSRTSLSSAWQSTHSRNQTSIQSQSTFLNILSGAKAKEVIQHLYDSNKVTKANQEANIQEEEEYEE